MQSVNRAEVARRLTKIFGTPNQRKQYYIGRGMSDNDLDNYDDEKIKEIERMYKAGEFHGVVIGLSDGGVIGPAVLVGVAIPHEQILLSDFVTVTPLQHQVICKLVPRSWPDLWICGVNWIRINGVRECAAGNLKHILHLAAEEGEGNKTTIRITDPN